MLDSAILGFIPGIPGFAEILIVAAIFLLLFGKRLPGVMRSLGSSIVEFKKGVNEGDSDSNDASADNVEDKSGGTDESK